ncbi:MAG: thioredoxin domain-containing protein [Myxococcota bacterium]|nr:thioredoxin domain-containing protein [Myxococcota bacterium]
MRLSLPITAALLVGCNAQTADTPSAHAAGEKATASAAVAAGPDMEATVATWTGGSVSYGELYEDVKGQLIRAEVDYLTARYQTESQALESKLMEALLEAEAAKQGMADVEALLKKEIEDKVSEPTEDEMKAFYEVMKRQLRGAPYESVKTQVAGEIMRRKQTEVFGAYIEGLKGSYKVKIELAFPDLPRIPVSADDDPSIGPEDAPITIVQFAEYQCPYCGKAGEAVDEVMAKYGDKVRMVYRDFPLSFHPRAIPAAIAANCAGDQGKYWEMHKLLMNDQRALEEADLTNHATTLALDLGKWNTCREDPAQAAEVQKDFEDGQAAGVSGTPAFFINGVMLSGAQPFSEFERIIERELEAG